MKLFTLITNLNIYSDEDLALWKSFTTNWWLSVKMGKTNKTCMKQLVRTASLNLWFGRSQKLLCKTTGRKEKGEKKRKTKTTYAILLHQILWNAYTGTETNRGAEGGMNSNKQPTVKNLTFYLV